MLYGDSGQVGPDSEGFWPTGKNIYGYYWKMEAQRLKEIPQEVSKDDLR